MDNTLDEDIEFIEKSVNDFERAMSSWVAEAWDAFEFVAGRQYSLEEETQLKARLRPVIIFNLIDKFISSVSGTEISNDMDARYYPSTVSRSGPVEVIQEVIDALLCRDNDLEHTEAFSDALTCGYGWLSSYIDEEEGFLQIKETRVDPFEMGWDYTARKRNLTDSAFVYQRKYMSREEVECDWPDKVEELKMGQVGAYPQVSPTDSTGDYRGIGLQDFRGKYAVIKFQRRKYVRYIKFKAGGEEGEVKESKFSTLKKRFEEMGSLVEKGKVFTKVEYYQYYYCKGILLEDPIEINGFSYICTTGKRDITKNYFYGLVRVCRDPQRWVNKFFGNIMHTMSTSGQGLFIEQSAVAPKNAANFEADYARPDKIKWLMDGAISGKKFQVADQTPMPTGLPQLLDFSVNAINNTLGINLEFLGMTARTQSGPVESSRKRSGLNIIAKFFQSRRGQMRLLGERRLDYMQNYVPEELVFSIVDQLNKPYLKDTRDPLFSKYYVRVDEAPNSADVKSDVWTIIIELIPYLMNVKIPPVFLVTLLKYSPLPAHIVDELYKIVNAPPQPEETQAKQLQLAQLEGDVQETKSKAALNIAKALAEGNSDSLGEVINILLEMQKGKQEMVHTQQEHDLKMKELQAGTMSTIVKTQAQMALAQQKADQPKVSKSNGS